jgi:exosome complex RNA-binding protein Rrp4
MQNLFAIVRVSENAFELDIGTDMKGNVLVQRFSKKPSHSQRLSRAAFLELNDLVPPLR